MRLKTENDIVFALLKSALNGTLPEIEPLETSRWWQIFRLAQRNHVTALAAIALPAGTPREVLIPWLAEQQKAANWYRYQLKVQEEVVATMKAHGIETLVLKGTHLAQYYPRPELREFGDLDLYFYDRHTEADAIASRELKVTVEKEMHHHTKYDYHGVTVESHYDFFNSHYPKSNNRYNQMLASQVSSPSFDVLHFLRHAAIHFAANGLNLRDLCDWALIVSNNTRVDWVAVKSVVERFGMSDFMATLDSVTHEKLGVASPMFSPTLFDPTLSERLLEDILISRSQIDGLRQYLHSHWKHKLAFNDTPLSLLLHKTISHLSH